MTSIALLVDHPQRDLLGLVLVAHSLCKAGVVCHLVPAARAKTELAGLAPDLVLLNHFKSSDEDIAELLKDIGSEIAVLDTEGGVIESFNSYERSLSSRTDLRESVRCYCAWGPRCADGAHSQGWFPASAIVITGPPRFDFYSAPWKTLVPSIDNGFIPSDRPAVLIAGTFTLANPRFLSVQDECKILEKNAHLEPSFIRHRLRSERETLHGMIELSGNLASWAPWVDWVYRAHPFERRDTYEKALSERVLLRCDGSIQRWLLSVRALIQRGSTTAIEAAIAGIPVLMPEWLPDWAGVETIQMVSTPCSSIEDMKQALESILKRPADHVPTLPEPVCREIQDWFFECDGNAHDRVAESLLTSLPEKKKVNRDRALSWFTGALPKSNPMTTRFAGHVRKTIHIPKNFSLRQMRFRDERLPWDDGGRVFSAQKVNRVLRLIHSVAGDIRQSEQPTVVASPSNQSGSYLQPYSLGRSVTVTPFVDRV